MFFDPPDSHYSKLIVEKLFEARFHSDQQIKKAAENSTIPVPQLLIDACISDPLYFPLSVLEVLIPRCHADERKQLFSTLQTKLQAKQSSERKAACEALAVLGPLLDPIQTTTLISVLEERLHDEYLSVRMATYKALSALGCTLDSAQMITLITKLQKQLQSWCFDYEAVCETLAALGPLLNPVQMNAIILELPKQLQDKDSVVRLIACNTLEALGPQLDSTQIPPTLITELQNQLQRDGYPSVERAVCKALVALGPQLDPAHIPSTLINELKKRSQLIFSASPDICMAACRVLAFLGPKLDPAQMDALIDELQKHKERQAWSPIPIYYDDPIEILALLFPFLPPMQQDKLMQLLIQGLEKTNEKGWFSSYFEYAITASKVINLSAIHNIFYHSRPECLSLQLLQLLQLVQKELKADNMKVRELAWDILTSLSFHFPREINAYLEQCSVDTQDWTSHVLGFLLNLSESQKAQVDALELHSASSVNMSVTGPDTLFSSDRESKNNRSVARKLKMTEEEMTEEEREELRNWHNI